MFKRNDATQTQSADAEVVPVTDQPPAECPDLGTFAARKHAAEANQVPVSTRKQPMIVSLGHDKKLFKDQRNKDVWLHVELGVDWRNRNHRYYRVHPADPWSPLFDTSTTPSETVESVTGTVDPRARFATSTYRLADQDSARLLTEMD